MKYEMWIWELVRAAQLSRPYLITPDNKSVSFWARTLETRNYTTQQATNAREWILFGKWWDAKKQLDLSDFTPTLEQLQTTNRTYISLEEHKQKVQRALLDSRQTRTAPTVFENPDKEKQLRAEILEIGSENIALKGLVAQLKQDIEKLHKHLQRKDEQIERLQNTVEAKTNALNRYNSTFHEV